MFQYSYIARDGSGRITRGNQPATSPHQLQAAVEAMQLQLISWSEVSAGSLKSSWPRFSLALLDRPSWQSIEVALKQLAMMLRSGLDLRSALQTVAAQATSRRLKRAFTRVVEAVQRGQSFAGALQAQGGFPPIVVQLVAVGEASGTLSDVLDKAARHMEQRRVSINTVRVALAYPTLVAVAAISIALYLIVSVIPQLQKFLTAMGRKLPAMTQSLVDLSVWCHLYGQTVFVVTAALCMALVAAFHWAPARLVIDACLLRLPIIGKILQLAGTGTLASSLSVMTRSGLQLVESLTIATRLQSNRQLARCIQQAEQAVRRGEPLATSLNQQPGYAPMLTSMLDIAGRTGQLESALEEVSKWCDTELQSRVKRLSMLVEPAIIVVAGGIVGYVYMAFFMALMSAGAGVR